jgi:hypothetical protein
VSGPSPSTYLHARPRQSSALALSLCVAISPPPPSNSPTLIVHTKNQRFRSQLPQFPSKPQLHRPYFNAEISCQTFFHAPDLTPPRFARRRPTSSLHRAALGLEIATSRPKGSKLFVSASIFSPQRALVRNFQPIVFINAESLNSVYFFRTLDLFNGTKKALLPAPSSLGLCRQREVTSGRCTSSTAIL